jgi:hypothetical protein
MLKAPMAGAESGTLADGLEALGYRDMEDRFRVPAQARALRGRLSTARRHGFPPRPSLSHRRCWAIRSGRSPISSTPSTPARGWIWMSTSLACLFRRQLQPLSDRRQCDLSLWLLLRGGMQYQAVRRRISSLRTALTTSTTTATPASAVLTRSAKPSPLGHIKPAASRTIWSLADPSFIAASICPECRAQMPRSTVQDGAVYTYIGSENIYQPNMPYQIESPEQQAGPLSLADFDRQSSGISRIESICRAMSG